MRPSPCTPPRGNICRWMGKPALSSRSPESNWGDTGSVYRVGSRSCSEGWRCRQKKKEGNRATTRVQGLSGEKLGNRSGAGTEGWEVEERQQWGNDKGRTSSRVGINLAKSEQGGPWRIKLQETRPWDIKAGLENRDGRSWQRSKQQLSRWPHARMFFCSGHPWQLYN